MKKLTFKCTLLTDVILNQNAATVGNQQTLDFIPGNNFLGIAAGKIYGNETISNGDKLTMFHTGDIRFGDAHPSLHDKRALKIAASMFYPKLGNVTDTCYIHHGYDRDSDSEKLQLKQCREGFYVFDADNNTAEKVNLSKSFAIKSAYDALTRRSEDSKMYGYQSLDKGLSFIFDLEFTEKGEIFMDDIKEALEGERRIGRSRTAQFGLVNIELLKKPTEDISTDYAQKSVAGDQIYTVYADSRLIFIDRNTGMPTFRPEASDLGFESGDIDWKYSQIRTFQYAPWNFKRQSRDTDRCGIEKGSVFVVKAEKSPSVSCYVGDYQNEGFGHVIYNPAFLNFNADANGLAMCKFLSQESEDKNTKKDTDVQNEINRLIQSGNPLLHYLASEKRHEQYEHDVYEKVNKFVLRYEPVFHGERFASQWGTIRTIASQYKEKNELSKDIKEYISHGVAKEQWEKKGRSKCLMAFIDNAEDSYAQMAIINLAAEMAKLARK